MSTFKITGDNERQDAETILTLHTELQAMGEDIEGITPEIQEHMCILRIKIAGTFKPVAIVVPFDEEMSFETVQAIIQEAEEGEDPEEEDLEEEDKVNMGSDEDEDDDDEDGLFEDEDEENV